MNYLRTSSLFSIVIILLLSLSGCAEPGVDPITDSNKPSDEAPKFSLKSLDGNDVSLSNFSGKPLVIFFFGSTCPLCISSAPSVESGIKQAFNAADISIIGIDTWNGNQVAMDNFKSVTGVSFDLLLDGSEVGSDYNTTYDRLIVVDKGKIVFRGKSSASNDVDDVVELLEELLM